MTIDITTALLRSSQSRIARQRAQHPLAEDGVEQHGHGDREGRDPGEHGDGHHSAGAAELGSPDGQPGGRGQQQHLGVGVGEQDGQPEGLARGGGLDPVHPRGRGLGLVAGEPLPDAEHDEGATEDDPRPRDPGRASPRSPRSRRPAGRTP